VSLLGVRTDTMYTTNITI